MSTYYQFKVSEIVWPDAETAKASIDLLVEGGWLDSGGFWLDEMGQRDDGDERAVSEEGNCLSIPEGVYRNLGHVIPNLVRDCRACFIVCSVPEEEILKGWIKDPGGQLEYQSHSMTEYIESEGIEEISIPRAEDFEDPDDYEFERQVFVDRAASVFEVAMEALPTSVEDRVGDSMESRFLQFPDLPEDKVAILKTEDRVGNCVVKLLSADPEFDFEVVPFLDLTIPPDALAEPTRPPSGDAFFAKDYSEGRNIVRFLLDEGFLERTDRAGVRSGFVEIGEYKATERLESIAFKSEREIIEAAAKLKERWVKGTRFVNEVPKI